MGCAHTGRTLDASPSKGVSEKVRNFHAVVWKAVHRGSFHLR
jgi:hypothetical protein